MRILEADLNMRNRTTDWKIPLGSINAIRKVQRGERVRLEGVEHEVEAVIEIRNGLVVASPRWETLGYLDRPRSTGGKET